MPTINASYLIDYEDWEGQQWYVTLSDTYLTSPTGSFDDTFKGQTGAFIEWHGQDDDLQCPIITSTCQISIEIESAGELTALQAIYDTGYVDNWFLQVWKGESTMKWWGFVNPSNQALPNAEKRAFKITGSDILANIQGSRYWEEKTDPDFILNGGGTTLFWHSTRYRFSSRHYDPTVPTPPNTLPTNFMHNPTPTIVEFIMSLLFDLLYDPATADYLIDISARRINVIEDYSTIPQYLPTTPTGTYSGSLFQRTIFNVNQFLYLDFPAYLSKGYLWPVEHNYEASVFDTLKGVLELYNLVLKQKDGVYYLYQPAAFSAGGTLSVYRYELLSTGILQDYSLGHTTVDESGYIVNISSPQTDPLVSEGGEFSKLEALNQVILNGSTLLWSLWQTIQIKTTKTTSTMASPNKATKELIALIDREDMKILENHGAGNFWNIFSADSTVTSFSNDAFALCILIRMYQRNGTRDTYEGILYSFSDTTEASLFNIEYDSKAYLNTRMSWDTESGIFEGKWLENDYSNTSDLSEFFGWQWWNQELYMAAWRDYFRAHLRFRL